MYSTERHSHEDGRSAIVNAKSIEAVFTSGLHARSGVHECGRAAVISYNKVAYFSNFSDNRVYTINTVTNGSTQACAYYCFFLTLPISDDTWHCHANFVVHPTSKNLATAVLEYHPDLENDDPENVSNGLCTINITTRVQPLPLRDPVRRPFTQHLSLILFATKMSGRNGVNHGCPSKLVSSTL